PVEARTELKSGPAGRTLRIADAADPGWKVSLDGASLKPVKVDGWAQGFQLPANGGRLELTYETSTAHTAWVWLQGFLAVVVVVLALPGRRREVDDDLPEAAPVPVQAAAGEGRRARRLRAAADAAEGTQGGDPSGGVLPEPPPGSPPVPAQGMPGQGAYDPEFDSRHAAQQDGTGLGYGAEYGQTYGEPQYEPQQYYGEGSGGGYGQPYGDQYGAQEYDEYAGSADPYGYDPRYPNRSDQQ
ncbi:MAG TPA: family 2 glycosyl transferase, partial [Streptomyces sp.]|nr:family 2 glycosyl transferase [Streptomyces sp.]